MSSPCPPDALTANEGVEALPTEVGLGPGTSLHVATPSDAESAQPALCHYCRILPGSTRDHVVPRVLLERGKRMLGGYTNNSVPACGPCNGRKGSSRVEDCCAACESKWEEHGPVDWRNTVPTVTMIYVTKKAKSLARQ